jgi:haloalkane dehalogenase
MHEPASDFLDLDGLRYHYLDEGAGEPVVMVHGNPTWSYYYRNLVAGLRESHRCIVPDHIGCGLSDKPGDDRYRYVLERRIDDLEQLLDHLAIRGGITLVVHDWGGPIGLGYATRHPERIARLVILNTAAYHLPPGKSFPHAIWPFRKTPLGPLLIRVLNLFCRMAVRRCVVKPMDDAVRAEYLRPYDSYAHRIGVCRFVQDIPVGPGDASYDEISRIEAGLPTLRSVPMLIAWGMADFVFDADFLAEWQRRFPEAEVHRFANAGHYLLEDAHAELVPLVRDFLARHPLPAPVS